MIKLAQPFIPEKSKEAVLQVLESGNLVQGKFVKLLEEELSIYLGINHAYLVSSGTAALHLALIALGIGIGDEVIVPAFTFTATANVVELVGAKPVLVDIRIKDFNIDTQLIENAVTSKTRAIIPVHEFGAVADIQSIRKIAQRHNLVIIEDAACALGASDLNKKAGTSSTIGCFSFHPRKIITSGEGGLVVTNDQSIAGKIGRLRNHGIWTNNKGVDFILPGFNYRLTDFQAALAYYQFKEIDMILQERINQAGIYNTQIDRRDNLILPFFSTNGNHIYQTYHVILNKKYDRNKIINRLKEKGIETNIGAQAIHCLKYYKEKYGFMKNDFPIALQSYEQGLSLPLGKHLNNDDIKYISNTLNHLLRD